MHEPECLYDCFDTVLWPGLWQFDELDQLVKLYGLDS
jgi:hypothetical protein